MFRRPKSIVRAKLHFAKAPVSQPGLFRRCYPLIASIAPAASVLGRLLSRTRLAAGQSRNFAFILAGSPALIRRIFSGWRDSRAGFTARLACHSGTAVFLAGGLRESRRSGKYRSANDQRNDKFHDA